MARGSGGVAGTLGSCWRRSREIEIITLRANREKWIYRVDPDRGFPKTPALAQIVSRSIFFFLLRTSASLRNSDIDPRLDWTDF